MKRKKVLSILLILGMTASLAACGNSESGGGSGDSGSDEDVVTIVYMRQAGNTEVEDELIKEFEEQNPGIKVQANDVPTEECYNKLTLAHNAGNPPDVIMTFWTPDAAGEWYAGTIAGYICGRRGVFGSICKILP